VAKTYDVTLRDRLKGHEGAAFAEGKLMLRGEDKPLLPAVLEVIDETHARLTITEGRYHQVKRMFAAMENEVIQLHRSAFGALALGDLPQGQWRFLSEDEMAAIAR
jgi:16S rRNA pseudouridine516 synthase